MKKNFFFKVIINSLVMATNLCFAHTEAQNSSLSLFRAPGNWFISLGAGAQHPQWRSLMRVNNELSSEQINGTDFYATKNQSKAVLSVYAGKRWERPGFWFPAYSLGAFWQYFFRTHLGKSINLNSEPEQTNYQYNWDLTANLLLASAKINFLHYKMLLPFINGGIGSSFNRTSDYKEKAFANTTPRVSPNFKKFSTSEFAYQLGVGIDLQLTPQLIGSIGYNYQDLGQISSGPGKGIWASQSLNPGSYHSNEFLVSITYLLL